MTFPDFPLGEQVDKAVDWMLLNLDWLFDFIKIGLVRGADLQLLVWPTWFLIIGALIALGMSNWRFALRLLPERSWRLAGLLLFAAGALPLIAALTLGGVEGLFRETNDFLIWVPPPVFILILMFIGWRFASWRVALFVGLSLFLIGTLGLWEDCMITIALIAIAVGISVAIGIPLGIVAARNNRVDAVVRPVLDFMQTMPAMVYLIPVLMFFGLGAVPGVMATVVFAVPPAVRLTNLGIRQVSPEVVEAANAFGFTSRQLLFKVQIPLAMPSIMAGVNQTIMLSLSMIVLAAMVATKGLGLDVLRALAHADISLGFEAGLAVVLIAMILDRITLARGKGRKATPGQ